MGKWNYDISAFLSFPSSLLLFGLLKRCEAPCWSPLLFALWVPLWKGAGTLAPSECCHLPSTLALVYKEGPWRKLSLPVAGGCKRPGGVEGPMCVKVEFGTVDLCLNLGEARVSLSCWPPGVVRFMCQHPCCVIWINVNLKQQRIQRFGARVGHTPRIKLYKS